MLICCPLSIKTQSLHHSCLQRQHGSYDYGEKNQDSKALAIVMLYLHWRLDIW
jgi:hypothetical protein